MDDLAEDECDDFKQMLEYTDKTDDAILDMQHLMESLKDVTRQILGPCPKELKTFYKEHKEARKLAEKNDRERRKEEAARAKEFNEALEAHNASA